MNNTAKAERSISVTILLTVLMIFLGISAATGGLNKAETTNLSDQNDVLNTILPLSQLNEPGFQEGSIFDTDTTLSSELFPHLRHPRQRFCVVLGARETTANWVMVQRLTNQHPRSPAASVRVAQQLSLPEVPTPAPSSTTVLCRAGDTELTANWVMEDGLTKPHPHSRAASVRVAQQ